MTHAPKQPRTLDNDEEIEEIERAPRPYDPNGEEAGHDFDTWTPPGDYGYQGPGE